MLSCARDYFCLSSVKTKQQHSKFIESRATRDQQSSVGVERGAWGRGDASRMKEERGGYEDRMERVRKCMVAICTDKNDDQSRSDSEVGKKSVLKIDQCGLKKSHSAHLHLVLGTKGLGCNNGHNNRYIVTVLYCTVACGAVYRLVTPTLAFFIASPDSKCTVRVYTADTQVISACSQPVLLMGWDNVGLFLMSGSQITASSWCFRRN